MTSIDTGWPCVFKDHNSHAINARQEHLEDTVEEAIQRADNAEMRAKTSVQYGR